MNFADLKAALHTPNLARSKQLLLLLSSEPNVPKSVAELRALALSAGIRRAKTWNISSGLSNLRRKAIRTPAGWELTAAGRSDIAPLSGAQPSAAAAPLASLRAHLGNLRSSDVQAFVSEAIACCEARHFRASVVLSWVGAVALLYDRVLATHLVQFNAEAARRDAKWKAAKNSDDLARMKEAEFLNVLEALSILGKSVKTELEGCLKLRNGCGHPNSLKLSEHRVASHLEILVLNVFSQFS